MQPEPAGEPGPWGDYRGQRPTWHSASPNLLDKLCAVDSKPKKCDCQASSSAEVQTSDTQHLHWWSLDTLEINIQPTGLVWPWKFLFVCWLVQDRLLRVALAILKLALQTRSASASPVFPGVVAEVPASPS